MMKKLFFLLLSIVLSFCVFAADENKRPIELSGSLGYGYNYTWGSYGLLDVKTLVPINPNFELDAAIRLNTANLYAAGVNLRPLFPLNVGEMYVETKLIYLSNVRNRIHDLNAAVSVGYRMDYVTVQLGVYTHLMDEFKREWASENEVLTEPISLLYSIEARVRPASSNWNLWMRCASFDEYQVERMLQPIFTIGAKYNAWKKMWVWADVACKPTGMFHLDATFYGIQARAGLTWNF
mgnify:CR=1 FL=1